MNRQSVVSKELFDFVRTVNNSNSKQRLWQRGRLALWAPEPIAGKHSQSQIIHPSITEIASCWMYASKTRCHFNYLKMFWLHFLNLYNHRLTFKTFTHFQSCLAFSIMLNNKIIIINILMIAGNTAGT